MSLSAVIAKGEYLNSQMLERKRMTEEYITRKHSHFYCILPSTIAYLLVIFLAPVWFVSAFQGRAEPSSVRQTLRIRAVGTVMMGSDFPSQDYLPPNDGASYFRKVQSLLADADLTFANLEGPLFDGGKTHKCTYKNNCFAFRIPKRYGAYLRKAGIDLISLANNHARDFGEDGIVSTTALLDSLGIGWSGPAGTFASVKRHGLRVGMVAFHTACHSNYMNDLKTAEQLVRNIGAKHDVVLVSFHGGAEGTDALHVPNEREFFCNEDRGHVRAFAHRMVDAGADLVIGHGPHVPRGMEIYRRRLIAYSLGNFATYGLFSLKGPRGTGLILEATLDREGRFLEGRILPTRQTGKGVPVCDPEGTAITLVRKLSIEDFLETSVLVSRSGRLIERFRPDLRTQREFDPFSNTIRSPVALASQKNNVRMESLSLSWPLRRPVPLLRKKYFPPLSLELPGFQGRPMQSRPSENPKFVQSSFKREIIGQRDF